MLLINNLSEKISKYESQIRSAIDRVLARGWLVLGPEVKHFEKQFADYLNVRRCVTLGNGTDAIELGLRAMGVKAGDLVATVANASMYATHAIMTTNAQPFFMDVSYNTQVVTFDEVKRAANANVKAIVVTHLYGLVIPEIQSIAEFCKKKNILLLEDCAQAHGAQISGRYAGTFGDIGSFSFYPTKNLGALGDGGALVTNHAHLADKLNALRQYGWSTKYKVELDGARNSRLDEMQAAILNEFLPMLDDANIRRRNIARYYNKGIKAPKVSLPCHIDKGYVAHLYVIKALKRDFLRKHLQNLNIASEVHYPIPDHRQPVFGTRFANISLPNTERLADEILTLPCYPEMTDEKVNQVCEAMNGWQI